MATRYLTRRCILAGVFAVAIGATVAGFATAPQESTLATCPSGESEDQFTGVCVPHMTPNTPQITRGPFPGELPEVDGVPCTGHNSNECIGLAQQQQPPTVSPTMPHLP